jgi:phosphohistidine phosphatase
MVGELVRAYGLIPDLVISSDAVQARLTPEAVAEAVRYAGEILLDPHLYLASPAEILSLLRTVRENAGTVMIVGHNPGLEDSSPWYITPIRAGGRRYWRVPRSSALLSHRR